MANTVSGMTPRELQDLIETVVEDAVERKLVELLGDPDDGLQLRKQIKDRLLRQRRTVAAGQRGQGLDEITQELGIN